MNKAKFDLIIKQNLIKNNVPPNSFGYTLWKKFENYYCKTAFDTFLREMQAQYPNAYTDYSQGKGDELQEHQAPYGLLPPKMASVASSSRFCYLALRENATELENTIPVQFEYECRIRGISGTAPQLDAYIPERNIFFEVKCHEIFDWHTPTMKIKYWEHIYGKENRFGFPIQAIPNQKNFSIPFSHFDIQKRQTRFDVKQFICHLLGIATNKSPTKKATLVYLFFKPKTEDCKDRSEIEEVFQELQEEIRAIFNCKPIQNFTAYHHITLQAIVEYSETMQPLTKKNVLSLL